MTPASSLPADDGLADVYDAAAGWRERRRLAGWSQADEAALTAWLEADAEHVDAYAAMSEVETFLDDAVAASELDHEMDEARAAFAKGRVRRSRRAFGLMAAGVVGVAVLAGAGIWSRTHSEVSERTYVAEAGRRGTVVLADGSHVTLDGGAAITARIGRSRRDIVLTRGRAFFDVAHDPGRPFEVSGAGRVVRALGTAFEVDLAPDAYRVALLRGRVRVSQAADGAAVELAPGQILQTTAPGLGAVVNDDVAAATAWREGRLVLNGQPLETAAAEINRRGGRPIVVRGAARALKISGAFGVDDPETFARAIAAVHGLSVGKSSDGAIVLSPAKDSSAAAD
ncbi:FecR family protein [Caulobacter sp. RHG1]|uniref:FecR family protein n=1 Tax=Caulobacter sp. (strain RHG1) TaxID=2545762 RepID=UPI001556740E|nr:FecR domain-containing protein [Caulobacter sp. RHG1]NQE64359.1 hypothetical protein [Caulobacter sp. RHG1]